MKCKGTTTNNVIKTYMSVHEIEKELQLIDRLLQKNEMPLMYVSLVVVLC